MNACRFGEVISISKESGLGKAYHESNFEMMKMSVRRSSP